MENCIKCGSTNIYKRAVRRTTEKHLLLKKVCLYFAILFFILGSLLVVLFKDDSPILILDNFYLGVILGIVAMILGVYGLKKTAQRLKIYKYSCGDCSVYWEEQGK